MLIQHGLRPVVDTKEPLKSELAPKPPLKWAGGKRWLAPHLASLWEPHRERRFVEPFCGGLAIPLALRPDQALLNDINPHLINFYTHLQRGLRLTIEMRNDEQLFYQHRTRFNQLISKGQWKTREAAQLFYYLNRTCFNGLCRFNKGGDFNVPFGTYKAINYAKDFSSYASVFKQWEFSNKDIEALELKDDDFVYADPPYDVEFTTYSAGGFSWDDQVRTANFQIGRIGRCCPLEPAGVLGPHPHRPGRRQRRRGRAPLPPP